MNKIITYVYFLACLCVVLLCSCTKETEKKEAALETAPLFRLSNADSAGLNFKNQIVENDLINFFTWKYIYNGGGVSIGDINNDGLPDIYFTSNMFSNKLYLNLGDLKFKDITKSAKVSAASGYKTGVTMVDINQDGWTDIYVCRSALQNPALRNNLVYINNQDLTFTEKSSALGLNDSAFSTQAYFFDYDQDNDLDLYLVNTPDNFDDATNLRLNRVNGALERETFHKSFYNRDHLYVNDGSGFFVERALQAGIDNHAFGLSASIADVNEDGYQDIFVGNDFVDPDFLYINNGDGTFTDQLDQYFLHFSQNSMGSDFADVNNDGKADLLVVDMLPHTHKRKKQMATSMSKDKYETFLKLGYGKQLMRNTLHVSTEAGPFEETAFLSGLAATEWSWSVLMEDLDADGLKDVFITNGIKRDMTDLDYMNFKADSIKNALKVGKNAVNIQNYKNWIENMPSTPIGNNTFRNIGSLQFEDVSNTWGLGTPGFSNGAAIADLDKDGDLDIVINNLDQQATLYENLTSADQLAKGLTITLNGPESNLNGIGSRIKLYQAGNVQSGTIKLSRGFLSSGPPKAYFGLNEGAVDSISIKWPDGKIQTVEQIDAPGNFTFSYTDARKEIDYKNEVSSHIKKEEILSAYEHNTKYTDELRFQQLLPFKQSSFGPAVVKTDINNDGLEDFFLGGGVDQSGALYLQNKYGEFNKISSVAFESDKGAEDVDAIFLDYDNDGDLDLYVVSGGNFHPAGSKWYQDRLYENKKGIYVKSIGALPKNYSSGSCVAQSDFNGDGYPDIFIGAKINQLNYPQSPVSKILINNKGVFEHSSTSISALLENVGMVTDALWTDLNSDNLPDLIVVGHWMPITVFRNNGNGNLIKINSDALAGTSGLWNTIEKSDVNQDGETDLIIGNFGLNTLFGNPSKRQIKMFSDDFDGNGKTENIIAQFEGGDYYPLARKEVLSKVIPSLNKKFISFESYASANIETLFSKAKLEDAYQLEINELRSVYLHNKGEFNFEINPLPIPLQVAPIFTIASEDIDSDGIMDYLFAGNIIGNEAEHGPYDAGRGYVLKGDGTFNSNLMPAASNDFLITGEARNIISLNAGEKKYIMVTRRSEGLLSFSMNSENKSIKE